jgi:hypothetical protein
MNRTILLFVFGSLLLSNAAKAQDRGFGLGMIVGEPTGISLKIWQGRTTAIDGALAWSFVDDFVQIHGDYLKHDLNLIKVEKGQLPFYYGIGGRIRFFDENNPSNGPSNDKTRLGVRVPLGLAYLFEKTTLDIFLEVVPILDLIPTTEFDLDAAIGIRYFF